MSRQVQSLPKVKRLSIKRQLQLCWAHEKQLEVGDKFAKETSIEICERKTRKVFSLKKTLFSTGSQSIFHLMHL